jgi:hypothetical protein
LKREYTRRKIEKVLRQNKNFVVLSNNKPYLVFVKQTKCIGEVIDMSKVKLIPVNEAKFFKYGIEESTGPVPAISEEKRNYLLEHFNCPAANTIVRKQYENLILKNH